MAGQLDKEVYQRRRADLGRLAERLDADIAKLEQKLKPDLISSNAEE